jgi:hypothetical protein
MLRSGFHTANADFRPAADNSIDLEGRSVQDTISYVHIFNIKIIRFDDTVTFHTYDGCNLITSNEACSDAFLI